MKLTLNYELSIGKENQALLPVIASMMGWIPSDGGLSFQEFLKNMIQTDVSNYFKSRIEESHLKYTGIAGAASRAVLLEDLKKNSLCTVSFLND